MDEDFKKWICELIGVTYKPATTCKDEDVCYEVCREINEIDSLVCNKDFKTSRTEITLEMLVMAMVKINIDFDTYIILTSREHVRLINFDEELTLVRYDNIETYKIGLTIALQCVYSKIGDK